MQLPCGAGLPTEPRMRPPLAVLCRRLLTAWAKAPYRMGQGAAPANGFAPWPTVPIVQNDDQQARRPTGSSQGQCQRALGGGVSPCFWSNLYSVSGRPAETKRSVLFWGADNVVRECQ